MPTTATVLREYGPSNKRRRVRYEFRDDAGDVIRRLTQVLDADVDAQTAANALIPQADARKELRSRKTEVNRVLSGEDVNDVVSAPARRAALWTRLTKIAARTARGDGSMGGAYLPRLGAVVDSRSTPQIVNAIDIPEYTALVVNNKLRPILIAWQTPAIDETLPKVKARD